MPWLMVNVVEKCAVLFGIEYLMQIMHTPVEIIQVYVAKINIKLVLESNQLLFSVKSRVNWYMVYEITVVFMHVLFPN